MLITIKLVVGGFTLNVISAYAPRADLNDEVKRHFWENLDEVVRGVPLTEKLFIGDDFNGHIGETARGYDDVHGGFGFEANTCFQKREDHLVTFRSTVAKTHIDYLFCRKYVRGLCTDCKVIPRVIPSDVDVAELIQAIWSFEAE
ncbi:uncharacterized protein [Nicotiana tomentosiformis]|uniref:uncharacterized protein n=1 Tax=Nicotiana tomentosiformis TaxID=4098 RepID=UPI00388CE677